MNEKYYKQILHLRRMEKRGQTTAYIIIAIFIVVIGVLIYSLYPEIKGFIGGETRVEEFMGDCLSPKLDEGLDIVMKQGGYIQPEGWILHNNTRVKYLCYTSKYFEPCYVQQPMLVPHVEDELSEYIKEGALKCAADLKEYYQDRGYDVTGGNQVEVEVVIEPEIVGVRVHAPMTFTRDDTQSYETFRFGRSSQTYDLLMTAMSIIDFESTYGDSEVTLYMQYYPELQLRKLKQGDGSTVYRIKNVITNEEFIFASRSLAWPGGLGLRA